MAVLVALVVPLILIGFAAVAVIAISCCCCCCSIPLCCAWPLAFIGSSRREERKYSPIGSQDSAVYAASVAEQEYAAIPIVEAYVVPPLEAHAHSAEQVSHTHNNASASASVEVSSTASRFKDVWAALLFLADVVFVLVLAMRSEQSMRNKEGEPSDASLDASTVSASLGFLLVMVVASSVLSSLSLYLLVHNAARIIDTVLWANIVVCGMMAALSLFSFQLLPSLFFALGAVLSYWYYYSVQARIPFASAVIGAACTAVKEHFFSLSLVAYAGLAFQSLWMLLWTIAMYGVWNSSAQSDEEDLSGLLGLLLLLSLYWGVQVIHYVVSVTAGGTVATWWFQPTHPAPVRGSFFRATTTSFGSICFGALLVAVVQTLREILHRLRRERNNSREREQNLALNCLLCLAEALLRCLEQAVVYLNRFAYSYVAAYGYDFVSAGKQVTNLFERRGWSAIINDNLISSVFSFFSIGLALVSAAMGALVLPAVHSLSGLSIGGSALVSGALIGGVVGFVVGMVTISCLDSAVAMVFVCFAEDPLVLRENHPETYSALVCSWELFNPASLTWVHANAVEIGMTPLAQARVVETQPPLYHGQHQTVHATNHPDTPPPYNPNFVDKSSHYRI